MAHSKPFFSEQKILGIIHFDSVKKSEEDLIRILARPKIIEMNSLYDKWKLDVRECFDRYESIWNVKFMKYYGWGWREFLIERKRAGFNY